MTIYTVKSGDSVYSIADAFSVPASLIISDNQLTSPASLVVGQSLIIRVPTLTHTVMEGETLSLIAERYGTTVRRLYQINPALAGNDDLFEGETIIIETDATPSRSAITNAYVYPFVTLETLRRTLPYLTYVTIFTYGIRQDGTLIAPGDDGAEEAIISASREYGTRPLMHLSTLTEEGTFSNELVSYVLMNEEIQAAVISNVVSTVAAKGYDGVDLDFEYIGAENAERYADFVRRVSSALASAGNYVTLVALAPKTSRNQAGLLYEGHDYASLTSAADLSLLMTYEWGYAYGPPMAVAPINQVRRVVDFALAETNGDGRKYLLGIPNYGYNWTLPYVRGESKVPSISNTEAVALAYEVGSYIYFNETSAAPYFEYTADGEEHIVWFEDARSIYAKLSLLDEKNLAGAAIWNAMKFFSAVWILTEEMFAIE
ncbi:MAG: glycosyl hydrolase family 18 protein [Firmicutes bacterium]|nr:glycosyl hydrolase family 18 protein [Bacillota bacterium]